MTDYLAEAQERMAGRTAAEAWAAVSAATDIRRLADAFERLIEQNTCALGIAKEGLDLNRRAWEDYDAQQAAEPEPSLVALDRAEAEAEVIAAVVEWVKAKTGPVSPDVYGGAINKLEGAVVRMLLADRIGGAA